MIFKQRKKEYRAIGINIYGGAFTLGVMKHFEVLGQWEEINLGKRTFDLNFAGLPRPLNLSEWPIKEHVDKVDFVYANPPCAPWSLANTRAGKTKASRFLDARLALTRHTYEAALALRPTVFISESVEAGYSIGASHYDQYTEMWMKAGYAVTFYMNDAILQGAPCMRRRFHFIAHRYQLDLTPPKSVNPTTVRDVIEDLQKIRGQVSLHERRKIDPWILKVAEQTLPGEPLRKAIPRIKYYAGPGIGFLVKRLKWDRPAFTMVRFNYIHPLEPRWITFREAMRLCTYPDSFMAASPIEAVDAVIPIVAEHLALIARRSIEKARPCKPQFNFIDWRPLAINYHINSRNYPV